MNITAQTSTPQPAGSRRPLVALLMLPLLSAAFGCAGLGNNAKEAPPAGIRADALQQDLGRIVLMPFAPSDPFGLGGGEREAMLDTYESAAHDTLKGLGLEALTPDALSEAMAAQDMQGELPRLNLDRPLLELFEGPTRVQNSEKGEFEDDRVVLLRQVAEALDVQTALIGRVVYHTDAVCPGIGGSGHVTSIEHVGQEPPRGERVPCAVSHFEAKLVDMRSGRTLWYNRVLRELRAESAGADTPDLMANARVTVGMVLGDETKGLSGFVAKP